MANINLTALNMFSTAKDRGVDLWHWMAFHQVYGNEERVASHFAKAGIKGFKVDFLDRGDADVARFMEKFADACARNKMHVEYARHALSSDGAGRSLRSALADALRLAHELREEHGMLRVYGEDYDQPLRIKSSPIS